MKYLLPLLLLSYLCHGQKLPNDVKITAYRLYKKWHHGPCSIASYVAIEQERHYEMRSYATAESTDKNFIKGLLALKKKAFRKADLNYNCGGGGDVQVFPEDPVPNMFVISGTNIADTLFTDESNQMLVFPDERKAFFDKDKKLVNSFPEIIKELYSYNFKAHIEALFYAKSQDSVSQEKLLKQGLPLHDFLNGFKNNTAPFTLISIDSVRVTGGINLTYNYGHDRDTVSVYDNREFTLTVCNAGSGWAVDAIGIGTAEKTLKKKFPVSTAIPLIYKIRLEYIKRQYYYEVATKDKKGCVRFYIKDKIIEGIKIDYYK